MGSISQTTNNEIIGHHLINLIETRKDIKSLLNLDKNKIDLIIPRGSMKFVEYIENNTSIPVLGHSSGLCHLYIDKNADLRKTLKILIDSKTNYPAACNSTETLLIHRDFANKYIKEILDELKKQSVDIFIGPNAKQMNNV